MLAREPFPSVPQCDAVLLRNVLISFAVAMRRSILGRVRKVVRPGGYLFLGGSETTMNIDDSWQRQTIVRATVYRPH